MRTNSLIGFYPRILHREVDEPIFAQHGKSDVNVRNLMEVNLQHYYPKTFNHEKFVLMEHEVINEIKNGFTTVNLALYYLDAVLDGDNLIKVKNVIADEMFSDKQYQQNYDRSIRRNKVHSIDADDGTIELASSIKTDDPFFLMEYMDLHCKLCFALNQLPDVQGRRIEAHYVLGISQKEIAKRESVTKGSVSISITRGLAEMKKILNNFDFQSNFHL